MLHRRIYQFLIIYFFGLTVLFLIKYALSLSDYVIPSPLEVWDTGRSYYRGYLADVLDTLSVAIIGHVISIFLATLVAVIGRLTNWGGYLIRVAAFSV